MKGIFIAAKSHQQYKELQRKLGLDSAVYLVAPNQLRGLRKPFVILADDWEEREGSGELKEMLWWRRAVYVKEGNIVDV